MIRLFIPLAKSYWSADMFVNKKILFRGGGWRTFVERSHRYCHGCEDEVGTSSSRIARSRSYLSGLLEGVRNEQ